MATHGSIGEFDSDKETWTAYTERLQEYFLANDVDVAEKQRAILLSVCGAATYQLIRDLVSPARPNTKTFDEIVQLVQDHHQPPPSFIVQRYNFNMRNQEEGETISAFIAGLRRLSEHCRYEAMLEDMLRDRLVCGVRDKRIQQRLLAEPAADLTFQRARELALATETATRNSQDLQASKSPTVKTEPLLKIQHQNISQTSATDIGRGTSACYRCGGDHLHKDCRFRDAVCRLCKKKGHIARACRTQFRGKPRSTHKVDAEQSPSDEPVEILALFRTKSKSAESMAITVKADQADLVMEVDTGASVSLMSETTYKQTWKEHLPHLNKSNIRLRTYSGEFLKVLGSITVDVAYENQNEQLPIIVIEGEGPTLLGKNWLTKIRLNWNKLVHKVEAGNQALDSILQKHPGVFKEGPRLVQGYSAMIYINQNSPTKFCKARLVA